MRYRIQVAKRFEKDFKALDKKLKKRVIEKVESLKTSPYSFKALHGNLKGYYSIRVGDYRIVYTVAENGKIVTLRSIIHRRTDYKYGV